MGRIVLYPGSFDPLTNGHLDLIERASRLFDKVIVGIARNSEKNALFSNAERIEMIERCTAHLDNIHVEAFDGLVVEAVVRLRADALLRGLRAFSDFEYELQMALMNRSLNDACETLFMMPTAQNSFVSSRLVKEVAMLNGNYAQYLPEPAAKMLAEKLASGSKG